MLVERKGKRGGGEDAGPLVVQRDTGAAEPEVALATREAVLWLKGDRAHEVGVQLLVILALDPIYCNGGVLRPAVRV